MASQQNDGPLPGLENQHITRTSGDMDIHHPYNFVDRLDPWYGMFPVPTGPIKVSTPIPPQAKTSVSDQKINSVCYKGAKFEPSGDKHFEDTNIEGRPENIPPSYSNQEVYVWSDFHGKHVPAVAFLDTGSRGENANLASKSFLRRLGINQGSASITEETSESWHGLGGRVQTSGSIILSFVPIIYNKHGEKRRNCPVELKFYIHEGRSKFGDLLLGKEYCEEHEPGFNWSYKAKKKPTLNEQGRSGQELRRRDELSREIAQENANRGVIRPVQDRQPQNTPQSSLTALFPASSRQQAVYQASNRQIAYNPQSTSSPSYQNPGYPQDGDGNSGRHAKSTPLFFMNQATNNNYTMSPDPDDCRRSATPSYSSNQEPNSRFAVPQIPIRRSQSEAQSSSIHPPQPARDFSGSSQQ